LKGKYDPKPEFPKGLGGGEGEKRVSN